MDEGNLPDRQTFIIRLWNENEVDHQWRGQLIHVPTGESWPFDDLADIEKIVSTYFPNQSGQKNIQQWAASLLKKRDRKGDQST